MGYYQGNGARLIADLGLTFTGIAQNACALSMVQPDLLIVETGRQLQVGRFLPKRFLVSILQN